MVVFPLEVLLLFIASLPTSCGRKWAGDETRLMFPKMEAHMVVASRSYGDPDVATLVAEANCDDLLKSLDPLFFALKLVSRGLISSLQARDILNRTKAVYERNSAFLNLIKSRSDPTWFVALLEALGEERTTERLKEVLEKSELLGQIQSKIGGEGYSSCTST